MGELTDAEVKALTQDGLQLLATWSRQIAMLPLEDWRQAFDRAETLGPILDPTLYRDYLHSGRGEIIKELLDAAIKLKAVVNKAQPKIREEAQRE